MTIQEIEHFFSAHPVPTGTMLNAAVTGVDPEKFLDSNLQKVKGFKGDISKCPSYWHLCELVEILNKQTI